MILLMECGGEGSSNELAALLRELPRELSGLGKEGFYSNFVVALATRYLRDPK